MFFHLGIYFCRHTQTGKYTDKHTYFGKKIPAKDRPKPNGLFFRWLHEEGGPELKFSVSLTDMNAVNSTEIVTSKEWG